MIVVDTSALAAVLFGETDAARYKDTLASVMAASMSVVSYVELGIITASNREVSSRDLDSWLARMGVAVMPVSERQGRLALDAYRAFGKGRHPARLNFGDCFAYALAKDLGQPLLFKGGDFSLTDIAAA